MENQVQGKLPEVLAWGGFPFAVHQSAQRTVYYPHGMRLEINLSADLVLVETLRVVDGQVEHRFQHIKQDNLVESDWNRDRSASFKQCITLLKRSAPPKREVIFGPSYHSIQSGIIKRFGSQLSAHQQQEEHENVRTNKKRVRWGDSLYSKVVDQPSPENKYSGWGLEAVREIPDRFHVITRMIWQKDEEEPDFSLQDEDGLQTMEDDMTVFESIDADPVDEEIADIFDEYESEEEDMTEDSENVIPFLDDVPEHSAKRVRTLTYYDEDLSCGPPPPPPSFVPDSPPPVDVSEGKQQIVCAASSTLEDENEGFEQLILQSELGI
jgi:hypothetical protein